MTKDMKPVKSRTRTGQFPEGTSGNPKGRMPGTRNTKTLQWEHLGEYITGPHAAQFNDLLNELWASHCINDRMKAAELFLKTLDYFKPKLQRVDATVGERVELPPFQIIMHADDAKIEAEVERRLAQRSPLSSAAHRSPDQKREESM